MILKNTSESGYLKGLRCEDLALQHYQKQGYVVLSRRLKTPFAEVDLLLKKEAEFLMVEVKSAPKEGFEVHRLTRRQKERLLRAYSYLSKFYQQLRFEVAFVDLGRRQVTWFDQV